MIKHCVFMRFKPDVDLRQRQALYESIHALRHHLPGWQGFVCGDNVTVETGMDKGFNGGFIIDLADEAARDTYLQDEEHRNAGKQLVAATEGGIEGILVFDMRI